MKLKKQDQDISKLISLLFVLRRMMQEHTHKKKGVPYSPLQYEALLYVASQDQVLMSDIAHYLMITPPGATLLVDGLVEAKFLARIADKKDRRIVKLAITPSGAKMIARGKKEKAAILRKTFSVLNQKERNMLIAILEKVALKK